MGDLLFKNQNGEVQYLNLFFNKSGEVSRPRDVYYNINGEVVQFPQLANLVLNIDKMCLAGGAQTLKNCSSFCGTKQFTLRQSNADLQSLGNISNVNMPGDSENFFVNPTQRFWGIGRTKQDIQVGSPIGFGSAGAFTVFFKLMVTATTMAWNNIFIIASQQYRLEVGTEINNAHFFQNGGSSIGANFSNIQTTANTIALSFDSSQVAMYLNGEFVGSVGITAPINNIPNALLNVNRSGGTSMNLKIFQFTIWNGTLNASEIRAIHKISMLGG